MVQAPEYVLVKFAGGRVAMVKVTYAEDGRVLIRLVIPTPEPKKQD